MLTEADYPCIKDEGHRVRMAPSWLHGDRRRFKKHNGRKFHFYYCCISLVLQDVCISSET